MHTAEVTFPLYQLTEIEKLRKRHAAQDRREYFNLVDVDHQKIDKDQLDPKGKLNLQPDEIRSHDEGSRLAQASSLENARSCIEPGDQVLPCDGHENRSESAADRASEPISSESVVAYGNIDPLNTRTETGQDISVLSSVVPPVMEFPETRKELEDSDVRRVDSSYCDSSGLRSQCLHRSSLEGIKSAAYILSQINSRSYSDTVIMPRLSSKNSALR
ncbi:hypothetical protein JCGZ_03003 [Jatropha curcas]|uniref:Uncharacterized protein n=1 Tax=Jatropha curcas TaxID=180498 RepID=A0A067JGU7_JATCU|nr:hypothetical protein JCGZ_03003 [Jatropha curcas]